jgi:hypothetical protein
MSWKYLPLENLPQASLTVIRRCHGGHTFLKNDCSDTGINDADGKFATIVITKPLVKDKHYYIT